MVRVIPVSDDKVASLLESGRTATELAKEWGVQAQTVRKAGNAGGWNPGTGSTTVVLPIRKPGPRAYAPAARNLRALERLRKDGSLPEADQIRLNNWLDERHATNTVVEYAEDWPPNPASPTHGGWHYAPRRSDTPEGVYYQESDSEETQS